MPNKHPHSVTEKKNKCGRNAQRIQQYSLRLLYCFACCDHLVTGEQGFVMAAHEANKKSTYVLPWDEIVADSEAVGDTLRPPERKSNPKQA